MASAEPSVATPSQVSVNPSASQVSGLSSLYPRPMDAAGCRAACFSTQILPAAADTTVCSSPPSLLFWNSKEVISYRREANPSPCLFSNLCGDCEEIPKLCPGADGSAVWIDASIAGPYLAL